MNIGNETALISSAKQTLILRDRRNLSLDGVKGVLEFTDGTLTLDTSSGRFTLEGEELRIETLDRDSGKIAVTGRIDAMYYEGEEPAAKKGRSFFRRG